MGPEPEQLIMYGKRAEVGDLDWTWVSEQLVNAAAYWTAIPSSGHPHPRPVWGIWSTETLYLSIGSPLLNSGTTLDAPVTAHLGSVTNVVIVEGAVAGSTDDPEVLAAYNAKYDWNYTVEEYGPFTVVAPSKVLAWRSAGWAGRDGFQQTGRWRFKDLPLKENRGPR